MTVLTETERERVLKGMASLLAEDLVASQPDFEADVGWSTDSQEYLAWFLREHGPQKWEGFPLNGLSNEALLAAYVDRFGHYIEEAMDDKTIALDGEAPAIDYLPPSDKLVGGLVFKLAFA